jgi:hypothetical protein
MEKLINISQINIIFKKKYIIINMYKYHINNKWLEQIRQWEASIKIQNEKRANKHLNYDISLYF